MVLVVRHFLFGFGAKKKKRKKEGRREGGKSWRFV